MKCPVYVKESRGLSISFVFCYALDVFFGSSSFIWMSKANQLLANFHVLDRLQGPTLPCFPSYGSKNKEKEQRVHGYHRHVSMDAGRELHCVWTLPYIKHWVVMIYGS